MAMDSKQYVSSDKKVKAAKAALADIKSRIKILEAQGDLAGVKEKLNQLKSEQTTAQSNYDSAVSAAQNYFEKNKDKIAKREEAAAATKEQQRLGIQASQEAALASVSPTDPRIPATVRQTIAAQKEKPEPFTAVKQDGGTFTSKSDTSGVTQVEDFAGTLKNARAELKSKSGAWRKALAQQLVAAGIDVPITETYTDKLLAGYQQAITAAQSAWGANKEFPTLTTWLEDRQKQVEAIKAAGGPGGPGGPSTTIDKYPTITNEQDGRITINKYFQDKLGRDATDSEFKAAYKEIIAQQKAKPKQQVTTRDAAGNVTYKTTGGTNTEQILNEFVAKKPKLQDEVTAYEASDASTIQREKDRKAYEKLAAAAAGDPAKMAALANTSYGKDLDYVRRTIQQENIAAGGSLTPEEIDALAKEAVDQAQDTNIYKLKSFIDSKLKFGTSKEGVYKGKAGENVDTLVKTAAANGIDLQKAFGAQLPDWLNAINKGESIETYKKVIRDVAKIGMPEKVAKLIDQGIDLSAIYAPYRNIMANTLEINPATIDMNDSTLRSAITAEKEVPLYEFERALRNDNRWQYTNQAKEEVSNATRQILRDFGFMG